MDIPFSCLSLVAPSRNGKTRTSVNEEMYFVIVLLLFPQVRAVSNSYNGFDACGVRGWLCEDLHYGKEIIFDCLESGNRRARLWIWTARLPSRMRTITARNCDHLELHVDCTRNFRETKIEEFRLLNIRQLVLLKPTNTYEYLHDNAPIPHIPPYFHLENIGRVNFYRGLFQGEHRSCKYNTGTMKKMVMKNVHIGNIEQGAFESSLDDIVWSNVTFERIDPGAIAINGSSLTIENSHITEIQNRAFALKAENVTLSKNRLSIIGPGSLNVYSHNFTFSDNIITTVMSRGLVVRSSNINFENNIIHDLSKDALDALSPAYYIVGEDFTPYAITYRFTGNEIIFMNRFSLHPNWKMYGGHACSQVTIDGNKFNCNCENLFWFRQFTQDGNAENAGFYQLMLNTTHHCGTSTNCSLSAIIPFVCQNETNLALQCSGLNETEKFDKVNFNATEAYNISVGLEGDLASETADTFGWRGSYSPSEDDSEMILHKSYYADKAFSEAPGLNASIWAAIIVAVIIKALCLSAVCVWYIKRKRRYNAVEIYKYDKTNDSDNLIIQARIDSATECENPSFPQ